MLFIASNFVLNGGSTFILRVVKERYERGLKSSVLIIECISDENILIEFFDLFRAVKE